MRAATFISGGLIPLRLRGTTNDLTMHIAGTMLPAIVRPLRLWPCLLTTIRNSLYAMSKCQQHRGYPALCHFALVALFLYHATCTSRLLACACFVTLVHCACARCTMPAPWTTSAAPVVGAQRTTALHQRTTCSMECGSCGSCGSNQCIVHHFLLLCGFLICKIGVVCSMGCSTMRS